MRKVACCVQSDEDTVLICRYICCLLSDWNQMIGHVSKLFALWGGVSVSHLEQTSKDLLRRKVLHFVVSVNPLKSSKCTEKYVDVTRRVLCSGNGRQNWQRTTKSGGCYQQFIFTLGFFYEAYHSCGVYSIFFVLVAWKVPVSDPNSPTGPGSKVISEDWAFCLRCTKTH